MGVDYQPRVVRGRIEMWVPHKGKEIAFTYPFVGPDTYLNVGRKILESIQEVPTGDYTASLLHAAFCNNSVREEPEFKDVRSIISNRRLLVFNKNLWTQEGVYVIQNTKVKRSIESLNVRDLEEKLKGGKEINKIRFSEDAKVRFAPKGSYGRGYITSEEFAKDGFIIASFNLEGAEKLGEVSAKFKNKPYLYSLNIEKGKSPELRFSTFGMGLNGDGLGVSGSDLVDCGDGFAFGVEISA